MSALGANVSADGGGALLRRALQLEAEARRRTKCLRGAAINGALLLALAADLSSKCEGYTSVLHWVELCMAGVAGANLLRLGAALLSATAPTALHSLPPIDISSRSPERSFAESASGAETSDELSLSLSPRRQWCAPPSASPPPSPPSPPAAPPPAADHFIADRRSLADYLQQFEERRTATPGGGAARGAGAGAAPLYQLATAEGEAEAEERAAPGARGPAALWPRLHLDPQRLTQFNLNLRLWLHVTILERLVREMEGVDAALARLGLGAALGSLAPERLRALARAPHAPPALPQLLPFLEPFPDQRYAVRRVRDLARGGALSDYRWSGGGAGWDDTEPTDAELLLHLLAAYLDAQLAGAGAAPGGGAFSAAHLSLGPTPPARGLAVHRVSARPPHYVLALDGATLELARGRNNLLHTLLVFLAAAAARPELALRRLHLGPAGLNMLWIIGR